MMKSVPFIMIDVSPYGNRSVLEFHYGFLLKYLYECYTCTPFPRGRSDSAPTPFRSDAMETAVFKK